MAIDLGTANTVVYVGGQGIVVSEPSVVASNSLTGQIHAVGADAEPSWFPTSGLVWQQMGTAAVSRAGTGTVDVFVVGPDGAVWHTVS